MIWRRRLGLERKLGGADFIFEGVIVALTYLALQIEPAAAASMCTRLAGVSLPQTKITLARLYRAGEMVSGVTKAPVALCRVTGTSKPSRDSNINFEVWIPTNGRWLRGGRDGRWHVRTTSRRRHVHRTSKCTEGLRLQGYQGYNR